LAFDTTGNLLIWDAGLNRILKMTPDGKIGFFAGSGKAGFSGDGGPATAAQFTANFLAIAVDSSGSVFLADQFNHRVRKVGTDGTTPPVARRGPTGLLKGASGGAGGPATAARLWRVSGLVIDAAGNLILSDTSNKRIRKVIGVAAPGLLAPGG